MRIRLLSITHKLPTWIKAGFEAYAKRLPKAYALELIEIPAEKRTPKRDVQRILQSEGAKMLSIINPAHTIIALSIEGNLWSTEDLANQLANWQLNGRHIDLLIGGPDGLALECLKKADIKWSLSPLTFPHALVRIIVAEQIYRAFSILTRHPYHR